MVWARSARHASNLNEKETVNVMLPKTILVPTDFGEVSDAAIDLAIDYARAFGGEVVLLHAYDMPIIGFPDGALVATADIATRILESAQTGLERQITSRDNRGVTVRGILKQGETYEMINEAAEELGAGLIVMGTHGRRGIARALIGSVTEKIVRTAKVPVMTVHVGDAAHVATVAAVAPASSRVAAAGSGHASTASTANGRR